MLEHFRNPKNVGRIDRPSGSARAENPACGDVLDLYLRVEQGRVTAAGFLCQGCSALIGAASYLTEWSKDRLVAELGHLDADQVLRDLGETSAARRHGVQLAIRALQQAAT